MTGSPLTVSVSNRKGGTGKTTTAVNLAAALARRGFRTLLVDLDTQGHAGLGFGLAARRGEASVHDLFRDPAADLAAAIRPSGLPGLWLAPADTGYEPSGLPPAGGLLAHQLARLAGCFDRVVIDTPPSLDALLINGIAAADGVLVPMLPHHLAAEGVRQLARLILRVATGINPRLKLLGLLPVMLDRRIVSHREVVAAMAAQFGTHRIFTGIRSDIQLAQAFAAGKPVLDHAPKSRGALDYHLLTEELSHLWQWPQSHGRQELGEDP